MPGLRVARGLEEDGSSSRPRAEAGRESACENRHARETAGGNGGEIGLAGDRVVEWHAIQKHQNGVGIGASHTDKLGAAPHPLLNYDTGNGLEGISRRPGPRSYDRLTEENDSPDGCHGGRDPADLERYR
jgi:hypothetical protein